MMVISTLIGLSFRDYLTALKANGIVKKSIRLLEDRIDHHSSFPKTYGLSEQPTYVVRRLKTGFIAQPAVGNQGKFEPAPDNCFLYRPQDRDICFFVFYPDNCDHAEIFSRSEVMGHGFADYFPGSVAVLFSTYQAEDLINLNAVQYSFKQGSPPELTRNLASKYMGSRRHLLSYLLNWTVQLGIPTIKLSSDKRWPKYYRELTELIAANNLDRRIELVTEQQEK